MERNFDLISCTLKTKVSVNKYKWQSMKKKMHTNVLAPAFDIAIFNDQAKTMNSMLGENGEIISEYMYLYMLEGMLSTKQNQSKWQLNKNSACVKKNILIYCLQDASQVSSFIVKTYLYYFLLSSFGTETNYFIISVCR